MTNRILPTENSLSKDQVKEAVYSYKESAVTDQLYAFGCVLLSEIQDRAQQINGKGVMLIGWSIAVLAFWFSQFDKVAVKSHADIFVGYIAMGSAALALLSIVFSYLAIRTREDWKWPSDQDWFQAVKEGEDELKRFHVRTIHMARQAQLQITESKGYWLLRGERLLIASGVLLALAVFVRASSIFHLW